MAEKAVRLPEANVAADELNALCCALGDRIGTDPQAIYWFKRLMETDSPKLADDHVLMAIEMGVLPQPGAYLPDGRPLFTFPQIAAVFGFEIGGLFRKAAELAATDAGSA